MKNTDRDPDESRTTYWKLVDASLIKKAQQCWTEAIAAHDAMDKLAKELGAHKARGRTRYAFSERLTMLGVFFKEPPNARDWKRLKNAPENCYAPRLSSREGKRLQKKMDATAANALGVMKRALGLGFLSGFSLQKTGKTGPWVLRLKTSNHKEKPKGCRRISDVEWERYTKKNG